jgi:hypothetical protein
MTKIYPASSWRNNHYTKIVRALRADGHVVYDFREANIDFRWSCSSWREFVEQLQTDALVRAAFQRDKDGLDWCDTCVLILPCGRSAHLEAMYASAAGKPVIVLLDEAEPVQTELMYLLMDDVRFVTDIAELLRVIKQRGDVIRYEPTWEMGPPSEPPDIRGKDHTPPST